MVWSRDHAHHNICVNSSIAHCFFRKNQINPDRVLEGAMSKERRMDWSHNQVVLPHTAPKTRHSIIDENPRLQKERVRIFYLLSILIAYFSFLDKEEQK